MQFLSASPLLLLLLVCSVVVESTPKYGTSRFDEFGNLIMDTSDQPPPQDMDSDDLTAMNKLFTDFKKDFECDWCTTKHALDGPGSVWETRWMKEPSQHHVSGMDANIVIFMVKGIFGDPYPYKNENKVSGSPISSHKMFQKRDIDNLGIVVHSWAPSNDRLKLYKDMLENDKADDKVSPYLVELTLGHMEDDPQINTSDELEGELQKARSLANQGKTKEMWDSLAEALKLPIKETPETKPLPEHDPLQTTE